MSSKDMTWETPQDFFDKLNEEFNFDLDVCASKENAKCKKYYNKDEDGLNRNWNKGVWKWMNPPYGREIGKWIAKASEERMTVALIPARTDTKYFHDYIYNKPNVEIRFIKGRLKFCMGGVQGQSAPFPSMVVIFR